MCYTFVFWGKSLVCFTMNSIYGIYIYIYIYRNSELGLGVGTELGLGVRGAALLLAVCDGFNF